MEQVGAAIGRPRLPLLTKGSLCAPPGTSSHKEKQGPHPSRLRRATFPGGEGLGVRIVTGGEGFGTHCQRRLAAYFL